jgi:hypothetical protein
MCRHFCTDFAGRREERLRPRKSGMGDAHAKWEACNGDEGFISSDDTGLIADIRVAIELVQRCRRQR